MTRGGALVDALLVTLATPLTWPLALGAFLVRGGILLVALPIVVLPTPVGLGTIVAPTLSAVAFGTIPAEVVVIGAAIGIGTFAWLVLGGWLAAGLEGEGARIVAADEDVAAPDLQDRSVGAPDTQDAQAGEMERGPLEAHVAGRILVARLVASLPLAVVLAVGSVRLVFVTYRELTSPVDVATPILLRVLLAAPEVVIAVIVAWMLGEIVGAVAARRIVLGDDGVGAAVRYAVAILLRHPLATLMWFWLPTLVLLAVIVPGALAAASAWEAVGAVLADPTDAVRIVLTVAGFVLLWIVGLLLVSVVCAWRSAVWTVAEVTRRGTFGGSSHRRPGHWRPRGSSATL